MSKEGVRYTGEFYRRKYHDELKTGEGTIEYPNGDVYKGKWNSKTLIPVSHTLVRVNRALRRLRSETKVDEKGNVFKGKFDDESKIFKGTITLAKGTS